MKASKIRDRLGQSLTDGRIATIVRDAFEIAMTDGFVIAMTNDWVVIHTLDGVHLDDIVMLRLEDISRVWFRDDDAYHHRAIAGLGENVASFDCEASVGATDLIKAASAGADIFTIYFEVLVGEPLVIGRLIKPRNKSFDMQLRRPRRRVGSRGGTLEVSRRHTHRDGWPVCRCSEQICRPLPMRRNVRGVSPGPH